MHDSLIQRAPCETIGRKLVVGKGLEHRRGVLFILDYPTLIKKDGEKI